MSDDLPARILAHLTRNPGLSAYQLARALNLTEQSGRPNHKPVRKALTRLAEQGRVVGTVIPKGPADSRDVTQWRCADNEMAAAAGRRGLRHAMTDTDPLAEAMAEIRERNERRIEFARYTEYTVEYDVAEGDVRRLLAAVDAVLKLHAPTAFVRYTEACPNHYASIFGRLECEDCRQVERNGCQTCRDEYGNPAKPEDCKERAAILAGLTGKGESDG